jgi:hypothetical protein
MDVDRVRWPGSSWSGILCAGDKPDEQVSDRSPSVFSLVVDEGIPDRLRGRDPIDSRNLKK